MSIKRVEVFKDGRLYLPREIIDQLVDEDRYVLLMHNLFGVVILKPGVELDTSVKAMVHLINELYLSVGKTIEVKVTVK